MSRPRFSLGDLLMWVALAGLLAGMLRPMLSGPGNSFVQKLAVSADGSAVAALFTDGRARVWNATDGHLLATLKLGVSDAWDVALSSDARTLAIARPVRQGRIAVFGVELWDVGGGKPLRTLPAASGCQVAFSPQGGRLAWAAATAADLYQPPLTTESRTPLALPPANARAFWYAAVFSPDGQWLARRNQLGEIILFDAATGRLHATLTYGGGRFSLGAMAFSPDGGKLTALDGLGYSQFEATRKDGVWDFSNAVARTRQLPEPAAATSIAYLPDGRTLAAIGYRSVLYLDTETNQTRTREAGGFLSGVSAGGGSFATSDLYRVDLYDAVTGERLRTLWSGSTGVSTMVWGIALVIWCVVYGLRKGAKRVRLCHTCGQGFAPANKRDLSVDCPSCRRQAQLKTMTPAQLSREPHRQWLRRLRRLAPLGIAAVLLGWASDWRSPVLLLLLFIPTIGFVVVGLLRTTWYIKRRLTTDERRDLRLAERCAAVCGELRRLGGITVWTAATSKLVDEIEPQARVCRRRLEAVTGDAVPELDDVRALIFADRQTLARYMLELRLPLGSGPRFHAGYLFAPLRKLIFAERELFEQVAEPLARLRGAILLGLIEQTDPFFQQGWLTNGLASALARDDGDGELQRLARRMKAALLARRTIEPAEFFQRLSARMLRRVRRRGDRASHAWIVQYSSQAWSFVDFLCGRDSTSERRAAFQAFWRDAGRRRFPAKSLARHYGGIDALFDEWRGSITRQPVGPHQPPPPHVASWMVDGPLTTVANTAELRRNRIAAVRYLGELGFAFGSERLIDLLRGDDPMLCDEAVWALECISGEVRGPSPDAWESWWESLSETERTTAVSATPPA